MKPTQKQCIVAALLARCFTLEESFVHVDAYSKEGYDKNIYVGKSGSVRFGPKVKYACRVNNAFKLALVSQGKTILQAKHVDKESE